MPSGNKRILISPMERAISGDITALQAYSARAAAERLRAVFGKRSVGTGSINAPSGSVPRTALVTASAAEHDCLWGLLVRCDAAGYVLVDAGVAAFNVPSWPGLTADDSPYIVVEAPAVTDTALLPFVANAGPGVRWDVVECQPVDTLVTSTTRDVFDDVTQVFAPQNVDKVREARLTYRIRSGAAGGGLPAPVEGWMPLAIAMVPSGAVGYTACDFWDVRPLVEDRAITHRTGRPHLHWGVGPAADYGDRLSLRTSHFQTATVAGAPYGSAGQELQGYFVAEFENYIVGGEIRKNVGTAGTGTFGSSTSGTGGDDDAWVPQDPQNISSFGYSAPTTEIMGIGAFFPGGYSRWVRYSQAAITASVAPYHFPTSGRWPVGTRGILVGFDLNTTSVNQAGVIQDGRMPTQMDLAGDHWGILVGYTCGTSNGVICPRGGGPDGRFYWGTTTGLVVPGVPALSMSVTTPGPGTNVAGNFPAAHFGLVKCRAKLYLANLQIDVTSSAAHINTRWHVNDGAQSHVVAGTSHGSYAVGSRVVSHVAWAPEFGPRRWDVGGASGGVDNFSVRAECDGGNLTLNTGTALVLGYQL